MTLKRGVSHTREICSVSCQLTANTKRPALHYTGRSSLTER